MRILSSARQKKKLPAFEEPLDCVSWVKPLQSRTRVVLGTLFWSESSYLGWRKLLLSLPRCRTLAVGCVRIIWVLWLGVVGTAETCEIVGVARTIGIGIILTAMQLPSRLVIGCEVSDCAGHLLGWGVG